MTLDTFNFSVAHLPSLKNECYHLVDNICCYYTAGIVLGYRDKNMVRAEYLASGSWQSSEGDRVIKR